MRDEWHSMEEKASRRTRRAVLIGALVAVAFFAFLQVHDTSVSVAETSSANPSGLESVAPDIIESPPTIIRPPPVSRSLAPPSGAGQTYVGVYECNVNGQRVVSDYPCGDDAEARTLVIDQPGARDATAARRRSVIPPMASTQPYSVPPSQVLGAGDDSSRTTARWQDIDREIDRINSRMRQPYSTYEGNELRGRWHALKNERYQLGCGR